jgi:hypothetical protein
MQVDAIDESVHTSLILNTRGLETLSYWRESLVELDSNARHKSNVLAIHVEVSGFHYR